MADCPPPPSLPRLPVHRSTMGVKAALPRFELYLYTAVLAGALVWAGSWISEASSENINRKAFKESVKPGWHYFGRKMHRSMIFGLYGGLAVLTTMGWTFMALVLSHCVVLYSVAMVKKKWLCFVAGLTTLASIKLEPYNSWQNCERKDGSYTFCDLLRYNFYLPFFFFGPIMTFDGFHAQVNNTQLTRKDRALWNITTKALRHLGVILVVDVFFHYLYILTIPSDMKLVSKLSDWSLAGLAYSNLVYDWVKAAVMFGVINTVATLDHLDPPQPPKCITMLYVFSETHFDRGINDWLCKYVYDYIGGDHNKIFKELLATLCTFAITTLWLGPCELVYIWSFFNCFGLNFELWVAKLFSLPPLSTIEGFMGEAMSRRIRGVFNAANFWTIVLYNVLALNSLEFAKLVGRRLIFKGFPLSTLSVLFVTYCGVQLVKERERRQALLDDPEPAKAVDEGKEKAE
ncbi:Protein-cysteine N-palmitoyltransferase HHAT-like protein [Liparis tanakae]|uniref:Protein-cysteine N-palmitoyltransferase HHAT-like protein n=1 Tax=Liparis tanakae TaxID=230148 RepID=A0A4Z2GK79_9TELE|nr:Protein-cysteine N-palmitoyltransferase HHAT-like protein [Liparis tanakae]